MGDAQSAQREGKKDAAAEEGSGGVDDVQTEESPEDKPLKNKGQISEINGKADNSIAALNGHCEEDHEVAAEATLSPDEDVSGKEKPLKAEETPLENVEINEKTVADEVDATEEMTEMESKQNDINESFRKFFSNIGLKLTVKRGSVVPEEEANKPEDIKETAEEIKSENEQSAMDLNAAQTVNDNDSTTCPTLTDVTPDDALENADERTTEATEEGEALPVSEDANQDATPEKEPHPTSQSSPNEDVEESPLKRFFTTGIFSGLRKKKKQEEGDAAEKELLDMGIRETEDTTVQDQQEDEVTPVTTTEKGLVENEDEGKSSLANEPEILGSQEKDKVQASPMKKLLSGSSLKKRSKKQRGRKSSDSKLSDSGEHISDQHLSSTEEPAENRKEESPAKPSAEAAGEEDSPWASFIKLMTPKKRVKKSSVDHGDAQIPSLVEETKPNEGQQISDHSTEEGKKRKDSSVSWEAVLCGSGRRRSRRTSDSEEETPQIDNGVNKQDSGPKESTESPLGSSNGEVNEIQGEAGSAPEGDAGSTWKSLKKLVTPKRKAKDEDESKENIQSDSEVTQDDSSFSIKKLLPGRKKRKSAEKQDQVSSDEADREVVSDDEDSETPAVVPLSEFDTAEAVVHMQTQADIESDLTKADNELHQDLTEKKSEPVKPCTEDLTEAQKVQEDDGTSAVSVAPVANKEPDDLTDESLSKHQQLSDIPEEGIITDTMATPVSFAEEAVRDDTIAEDLIEMTSDAITAPEPVDVTLADETEMISAVSQLSDSSKTSGNATPVPAEYNIQDTEVVLQQVAENISTSPEAVPVSSEELGAKRIVGSVSHQINETVAKKETKILEIHRRSDATAITTGLSAEAIDAINELTATEQIESVSDINTSTEIISEEFDTAELPVDKVCEAEIVNESQHVVESLSEVNESKVAIAEVGEQKAENEISKTEKAEPAPAGDVRVEDQLPSAAADELDALADVGTDTLGSKEGSVQTLEKEEISGDIPPAVIVAEEEVPSTEESLPAEKVVDEPKETTHLVEETIHPEEKEPQIDAPMTEHAVVTQVLQDETAATLDSEEGTPPTEKEVISEDLPESIKDEPQQETVPITKDTVQPEDTSITEDVQEKEDLKVEAEVSLPDAKDSPTETAAEGEVSTSAHAVAQSGAQEMQIFAEDVTKPAPDSVAKIKDQMLESIQRDAQVEHEDSVTETVQELQSVTAVHLSSVTDEGSSNVQVVEVIALSEETPAPCADNAEASDEATHGVHVCEVEVNIEREKEGELPGVETKAAPVEHAVATQVTTCTRKDVSSAIPDVLIETTSEVHEPLIDKIASVAQFKDTVETAKPLVREEVTETAEEGKMVLTMHVSSLKSEDNHRIQVKVVDVDIKSAENVIDKVIEAGVTEDKQIIDVCQETIKNLENLSATAEAKEETINEEKGTVQEVIHHVKENLPETVPESVPVSLEPEVTKQPEVTEVVSSESKEVDELEMERQDEVVTSDTSAIPTEQQIAEDHTQSFDTSVFDRKEDLEEAEKSEVSIKAEEVETKKDDENTVEAQTLQTTQNEIVKTNNAGLAVPQNTGIISSVGNLESPSSLSLEFKLNIQFGQTMAPSSPPRTHRFEPAREADMSAACVQTVQEQCTRTVDATQRVESEIQTEVTVNAKTTEPAEPTERLVITNQPVLRDVGIQAMETIEHEQIKATENVTPNLQAAAITEPVMQRERREVILSQQLFSKAHETKTEEAVKQAEEETDQDVWLDAEEDICAQGEMEVEKPSQSEEKPEPELEFEMAADYKSEDEELRQETRKFEEMYDVDSEGEDFAVALEQPDTAAAGVATLEWD